jgi:feruloyl esterase
MIRSVLFGAGIVAGAAAMWPATQGAAHGQGPAPAPTALPTGDLAGRCAALIGGDGIDQATYHGPAPAPAAAPGAPPAPPGQVLPAHCEVHGTLTPHDGADGQHYAIRYHLRLPAEWNGRFFFQGGAGTNGVVGDALGAVASGRPPALAQGYAVVSQDSGHDNRRNADPAHGGDAVFGTDPRARADYGGASLRPVVAAARGAIRRLYGRGPERSYFVGCSKGGQEGMAAAQRYPELFDGIVAAAPGFALPRAALAQTWDVQTFGALARSTDGRRIEVGRIPATYSAAQLGFVRQAVLDACDADDGLADGIVGRFEGCTAARVLPRLRAHVCTPGQGGDACLSAAQVDALARSLGGPRDGKGRALYASFPWDGGVGAFGWRLWKLGSPAMPALNVLTGGPALATIFTVPPSPIRADPQNMVDWEAAFDMTRDAGRIYATSATFPRSAWTDIAARSPDLAAFRAHGGKLIVPHGGSDPVFSINDTLAWYHEVQAREHGRADAFVRVFPVPGMNHCSGGPATDQFDAFAALVAWVERGQAPDRIVARAGGATPWPGRTRPLCPYPRVATYAGHGSIEDAASFTCKDPRS